MKIAGSLFAIVLLSMTLSCKHVVKYECNGLTPTYTKNVKFIMDQCCATSGCHSANGEAFDLSTFAGTVDASKKKSFMGSIQHLPFYQQMPKNADRLADSQIKVISCWIENGSPE
ncbi:MAG: hypothetical protein NT040_09025 [Bacteroidetes bacterium]|nr:hypothetical protein [Bacteroidota bacterium]